MPETATKTRIITVDALRGMALFGILLAHIIFWYTAGPLPEEVFKKYQDAGSVIAIGFTQIFLTGKFFSFFSFLFGLSFFLQMRGLANSPKTFLARYSWRLALLMVIGIAHHTLWMGDILSIYVPLGFVLLLMRKLSNKWVLTLGVLLAINLPGRIISTIQVLSGGQPNNGSNFEAVAKTYDAVIRSGGWLDIFRYNITNLMMKYDFQISSGRLFITLGFFLLGMYVGRQKWFDNPEPSRPAFRRICKRSALIMCLGLILGLGMFAADAILKLGWQQNAIAGSVFMTIYDIFNAAMAVFFISGLTLLMYRNNWKKILYPLAPIGKMALTSYIMQTIFGLLVFYQVGLGLYTKISPGLNYLIAFAFFFLQILFSKWWLHYFNYGILEWLWRSGTLLKWQPLVKSKTTHTVESKSAITEDLLS